jgi:Tol biopolymer transport system component
MFRISSLFFILAALIALTAVRPSAASSPSTARVSVASDGTEASAESTGGNLSADGRFVVFNSAASNLVPSDANDCPQSPNSCVDVFVRDTIAGTTELINKSSAGIQSEGRNGGWGITPDGRYVVFSSSSAVLVPGDTNGQPDGFIRDRLLGTTERVTVGSDETEANGASYAGEISNDGRFVLFSSGATNLVPGYTNSGWFVRDRSLGTTEVAILDKDGGPPNASTLAAVMSADGRFVAFVSDATDLTDDISGPFANVFVRDRLTGQNELVSVAVGGGAGNGWSGNIWTGSGPISISGDGRYVAFDSIASDLVPSDAGDWDVFVRDRLLNVTSKISVTASGGNAFAASRGPRISADGRYVTFMSDAGDLVPGGDSPFGPYAVFVRDVHAGTTAQVSVDSSGVPANYETYSETGSISDDGGLVAFGSDARNLVTGDTNGVPDIFVRRLGDSDNDGAWDPFDTCPTNADCDADSVTDGRDNCPNWQNPNQALPSWPIPAGDPDCDGFSSTTENAIGTAPLAHCGSDAWPPDINNNGSVDVIGDIVPVANWAFQPVPPAPARYDISPNGYIDVVGDMSRMAGLFAQHC